MNPATPQTMAAPTTGHTHLISLVRRRHEGLARRNVPVKPFAVTTPDGCLHVIGTGTPAFTVRLTSDAGVAALASFNELAIAEAFMNGHLDIEGEMLQSLRYRAMLSDPHPIRYLIATYIEPLVRGQVSSDKRWIKSHYDID